MRYRLEKLKPQLPSCISHVLFTQRCWIVAKHCCTQSDTITFVHTGLVTTMENSRSAHDATTGLATACKQIVLLAIGDYSWWAFTRVTIGNCFTDTPSVSTSAAPTFTPYILFSFARKSSLTEVNNEICAFDGGDCCECECKVGNQPRAMVVITVFLDYCRRSCRLNIIRALWSLRFSAKRNRSVRRFFHSWNKLEGR